jgi:hypothetical protein
MVFGSVALGCAGVRSDLDVLGIIPPGEDEMALSERVARHFAEVSNRWKVLTEGSVITSQDIASRRHPLTEDSLFTEHLLYMARSGKYTVGDPAASLLPLNEFDSAQSQMQAAGSITALYTAIKRKEFFTGLAAESDAPNYHKLQRAFELPTAIGRKLLRLQELREWSVASQQPHALQSSDESYRRIDLAASIKDYLQGTDGEQPANWLLGHDQEYSCLLQDTLQGEVAMTDYEDWLGKAYRPAISQALRLTIAASKLAEIN